MPSPALAGAPTASAIPIFTKDMPLWIPAFAGMTVKIGGGAIIVHFGNVNTR